MAFGRPSRRKTPLGVIIMAVALALAAFIGASAGLIWDASGWFDDEVEAEVVTVEQPNS